MQHDLIEAYKRVYSKCWSQQEAYERMVKEPAPRFYVSAKQACQVISPMLKGDFDRVNMMLPARREMYYALFDQVTRLSERRSFIGHGLFAIMREAVLQPAPEFFISPKRARTIRGWLKKGLYENDGRCRMEELTWYSTMMEKRRAKREEQKTQEA